MSCAHHDFEANVNVGRIQRSDDDPTIIRFMADVTIKCVQCGTPFRFIGLPAGSDLNSPTVSVDGAEGRFPIGPKGEVLSVVDGPSFTVRKVR